MARIYARRVKRNLTTLEEVPTLWRAEVEAELAKE